LANLNINLHMLFGADSTDNQWLGRVQLLALSIEANDQDKAKFQNVNPCGLCAAASSVYTFSAVTLLVLAILGVCLHTDVIRLHVFSYLNSAEACCRKWSLSWVTLRFDK
jgi:hypothetical protein